MNTTIESQRVYLGQLCAKLRKKHGWSRWKVKETTGIAMRTIKRLEEGQGVNVDTLINYLRTFNASIDFCDIEHS